VKIAVITLALLLVVLAGFARPAQAHERMEVRYAQAEALSNMIAAWRASKGLFPTIPSLSTMTAVIAIQQANWQERRFGKTINGEPFASWSARIFGKAPRGIIALQRCHIDGSWKPVRAFRAMRRKLNSRRLMGLPFWSHMSVRSMVAHSHRGAYAGKGTCQGYYVVFAASLLEPK